MKKRILTLLLLVGILGTSYSQTDCYADKEVTAFLERLYNEGRIEAAKKYISNLEQLCEGKPPKVFLALKKKVYGYPTTNSITHSSSNTFQTFTETVNGVSFKMVAVKGGSFNMGSTDGEADEKPVHKVRLSNYYMGETEVTQALWEAVTGSNPSEFKGKNNPVERVTWNDAQKFIKKLNTLTGKKYRLPTEAEWEFAARGGVKSKGYKYSGSNSIDEVAWYGYEKSGKKTHSVKQKKPNELGLYDMTGNVCEWCTDWYDKGYYQVSPTDNPQGPSSDTYRLLRGGSWDYEAKYCRSSDRRYNSPYVGYGNYGFRLTLSTVQ